MLHQTVKTWKDHVWHWYPDLQTRSYFLPPVQFHHNMREINQQYGIDIEVPQPPLDNVPSGQPMCLLESDVRDDATQQHVLHCLKKIAKGDLPKHQKQVMFVLSQLDFGDYLGEPSYAAAAKQLPNLGTLPSHLQRGDFDVLIIHRKFGLLTGEIKAVGDMADKLNWSEQEFLQHVLKTVKKMLKMDPPGKRSLKPRASQLQKTKYVLEHLVKDIGPIRVHSTLILPNVTQDQLRKALLLDSQVKTVSDKKFSL